MKKIKKALLIIDAQNDFFKNGALTLMDSEKLIPLVNEFIPKFELVLFTMNWYDRDHILFNTKNFPIHCLEEDHGASLNKDISFDKIKNMYIFKKNIIKDKISPNAFYQDENETISTELDDVLQKFHVEELFIIGLSYDGYILKTGIKSSELGYKTHVITDLFHNLDVSKYINGFYKNLYFVESWALNLILNI